MNIIRNHDMNNVDQMFASSLEKIIRDNLGNATVSKIQDRLFEKFGMSLTQSINEFEKLDSVLREFFGAGAEGLEKKFLNNICSIKSKQDKIEKRFTIYEQTICKSILNAFSDEETAKILNASVGEPWTISEILEKLNISTASGYGKIKSLIEDGLLIRTKSDIGESGQRIDKFKSLFDNVNIDFNNNLTVNVQFSQDVIKNSSILQIVYDQ